MKHIYKVIYDISVDLVTFDLGFPLRSNQGDRPVKGLCLINGASYNQSLYEIHVINHISANQGHWVFSGLFIN